MNNVLRYEGYANLAMVGLASGGILNMAGDAVLMWGFNLAYAGSSTFHYDLPVRILWNPVILFPTWRDSEQPDTEIFYLGICGYIKRNILTAGFPSMMRQGLASVSTMVLNAQAAVYGDIAIAAMSVGVPYISISYSVWPWVSVRASSRYPPSIMGQRSIPV